MADIEQLVSQLEEYNEAYRSGAPMVDDATYDSLVEQLRNLAPDHPFLKSVEPESFPGRAQVRHPLPMLSTEKAYTKDKLARFVARVQKEASAIGIHDVLFLVTPKLDGLAGRDDGEALASRGNGHMGYDISSAFDKGVVPVGGRGKGLGEIVAVNSYFFDRLADRFEHPRNMVVGIVSSDTLNKDAQVALDDGMVHFVPYSQLESWQGNGEQLLDQIDGIVDEMESRVDYPMDGVVVEVIDPRIKEHMGATTHHYRWQIAVKRKGEVGLATVEGIQWQVGRTGNVTPVMEVTPVALSGATIRRVTAHHAGMVKKLGIGPGAQIELIRSGEVIPKLEKVLSPAALVEIPEQCPACGATLVWRGDFLRCTHLNCPAQIEQRLAHWFRTLGNADWFGIKTLQRLVAAGYDTLEKVYDMTETDFIALGFGPVQSKNLAQALQISRDKPVEDWRFLAALGIPDLGVGDSRKLLEHGTLESLPQMSAEQIARIDGFGEITSRSVEQGLSEIRETLEHLLNIGFNIEKSALASAEKRESGPLYGRYMVFSGKMVQGSREDMQAKARKLGANVQTSVNSKTDFLVCGENVGASKLDKARKLGVQIISEADFDQMANG